MGLGQPWRYDGRRVVVTGCASGIGMQTIRQLTELGAEIIGLDRRRPDADLAQFHQVDLADPDSIDQVTATIDGKVDALFNIAGVSSGGGEPRYVVAVNFLGLRHLTAALTPKLTSGSAIVNVSSLAARGYREDAVAVTGLAATRSVAEGLAWCDDHPADMADGGSYRVSKGAVIFYTHSHAATLAKRGIRINCTCPGVTDTPILQDTERTFGRDYIDQIPKPLGRVAQASEQAAILVFLNSPAASYLTGEVLWVDGGFASTIHAEELLRHAQSLERRDRQRTPDEPGRNRARSTSY